MSNYSYSDFSAVANRFVFRAIDHSLDALGRLDAMGHVVESVTVTGGGKPRIVISPPSTPIPGSRLAHRTGARGEREIVGEAEFQGCRLEWLAPALAPALRHG